MATVSFKVPTKGKKDQYILIETSGRGNVPRNAANSAVKKAALEFEEQIEAVSAVASSLIKSFQDINDPDDIEIEFGIELSGELGIPLVTSGKAKANFKVKVSWSNPKKKPS